MDFACSDLASECGIAEGEGVRIQHAEARGCAITRVRIGSAEAATRFGKPQGKYVTVECGSICELDAQGEEHVRCALAVEVRELAQKMCGKRIGSDFSLLVVGLGNADMTADALGPETVKRLCVTRHLRQKGEALFLTELCEIAAITPGVTGQTGVDAAELVRGVVQETGADLVVAVDALCARAPARLAATVQISDTGIQPGAGVGNARRALTRESIGVPVMAMGIPTVIRGSTLVADTLAQAGYAEIGRELSAQPGGQEGLLVAPKEIDLVISKGGMFLAQALEKAFRVEG